MCNTLVPFVHVLQRQWIVKSHNIESSNNKTAAAAIANFISWEVMIKCIRNLLAQN